MQFNTQLTINAEFLYEFTSYEDWVNNASEKAQEFENKTDDFHNTICIDKNGEVCAFMGDFKLAEALETYPVKCYALQRILFNHNPKA